MQYNTLGNTGLMVSRLCFGAMTFGSRFHNIGQVGQGLADQMIGRSLEAGVNFFDTADVYSMGESEEVLGRALQNNDVKRDDVVIASKVRGAMSEEAQAGTGDVNNVGLSRKHIIASCENSLRRLGTDYLDLYQIHSYDPVVPWDETLRALDDLVHQGKVRYVGCSNLAAPHIVRANDLSRFQGLTPFVSLQAYYSLVGRDLEQELLPLCREEGLGVMVWSPLAGGFLTGKYRRDDEKGEGRRDEFDFPPVDKEMGYDVVDALDEMATNKGRSIAQLALAWLLEQRGVSSVIVGASKMEQLEDDLGAIDVEFTDEELTRLDELTETRTPYPQWMIQFTSQREERRSRIGLERERRLNPSLGAGAR